MYSPENTRIINSGKKKTMDNPIARIKKRSANEFVKTDDFFPWFADSEDIGNIALLIGCVPQKTTFDNTAAIA